MIASRYEEGMELLRKVKNNTKREKKAVRNFWAINTIKTLLYEGNMGPFMRESFKKS